MLVVVCGRPCVGKTTTCAALARFLQENGKTVIIVNEESVGIVHTEGYKDLKAEANTRATLKAAVERHITRDVVVILDSMNYIKGYRYELFCISRAAATTRVTLFVEVAREVAAAWNATACVVAPSLPEPAAAADGAHIPADGGVACEPSTTATAYRYPPTTFDQLWGRFEPPDESNRWDSPLFRVDGDAPEAEQRELFQHLAASLLDGKRPKPAASTTKMVVTDTNYLHVLDKSTQDVVAAVTAAISMGAGVGESVPIPKCPVPVLLCRKPAVPELTRIRRQFIKVSSLHPSCSDAAGTTKTFVEYLNAALSK